MLFAKSKLSIVNLTNLKSLIDLVWKNVMFFSNWELPCLLLLVQEIKFLSTNVQIFFFQTRVRIKNAFMLEKKASQWRSQLGFGTKIISKRFFFCHALLCHMLRRLDPSLTGLDIWPTRILGPILQCEYCNKKWKKI